MAQKRGLRLALLWHMHQPYYEDLATGEHILPWVRLHALKDYWGMIALLREFPRLHVTFNLVPSLLVQIEAYAAERAQDRHLLIGLKPAQALAPHECEFLIANGFHAHVDRMIRPLPRYAELLTKREQGDTFEVDDLRDLQVLHKLVWMDPDWLTADPRLRRLLAKGRGYQESDKTVLREVELELLNAVIPAYKNAAAGGAVELSTSPFYHPILPLLCDTDVHLRAHPASALPHGLFAWPTDASLQLTRAVDYHATLFGSRPAGVWPSEGAVSDAVVALLAGAGFQWAATDEDILSRSLGRQVTADDLYQPYAVGASGQNVRMLFRDHRLSDLIGFAYQSWEPHAAAADFVEQLRTAAARWTREGEPTITVILDGENAWEHYAGGGRPFLRALYRHLQEATDVTTLTMSEATHGAIHPLASLFPGSWINGDFYIWAGHADDHRAWKQLAAAREAFANAADRVDEASRATALEELLIAEGSDWCWWYGDDHSSDHDREFDDLFRRHLRNVYRALGQTAPDELHFSNISTLGASGVINFPILSPAHIEGGDFSIWRIATEIPLREHGGTMHRVAQPLVQGLHGAAARQTLYLRIQGAELAQRLSAGELSVAFVVEKPHHLRLSVDGVDGSAAGPSSTLNGDTVVVAVPFARLRVHAGDRVSISLLICAPSGDVLEQHPAGRGFEFDVPSRSRAAADWVV